MGELQDEEDGVDDRGVNRHQLGQVISELTCDGLILLYSFDVLC